MKNHFFFAYNGNKREEVEIIFDEYIIKKYNNILSQSKLIIEPFCGSCSLSYYLSLKYPKHFNYILNDNDKYLIELLKIAKDEVKLKDFEIKINEKAKTIDNKIKYLEIIKNDNLESYFIKHKISTLRPGLYNLNYKYKYINLINCPIVNFLRTENIEIYNKEALEIIEEYKNNDNAIILLDPPYVQSSNCFYGSPSVKIYEYIMQNHLILNKAHFFLILGNTWIIRLLFKDYIIYEYNKVYTLQKMKTTHLLICSK
jgi:hypothetical protein